MDFAFLSWTVLRIYSKKNSLWWVYVEERLWSYITSISVCKKCRLLWTIAHDFLEFDRFQSHMVQSKDSTFFLLIVPRKSGPSEMRIGFSNTLKAREIRIIFSCFPRFSPPKNEFICLFVDFYLFTVIFSFLTFDYRTEKRASKNGIHISIFTLYGKCVDMLHSF